MSETYLVCKGATVYCSKSISNNNPATAVPLNITSQTMVELNGGKVAATNKDCTVANMNFGMCNNGSVLPPPCSANVLWSKVFEGAEVTIAGLKLLTKESEGICSFGGGTIKIAFYGQVAMSETVEDDEVSKDVLFSILPVEPEKEEELFCMEITDSEEDMEEMVKIASIDILDDSNIPVVEDFIQFVNLPKDAKFVNNKEIKGLYQLGSYIRCRVVFEGAGAHKFKIMLEHGANNIEYSKEEQNRNPNFTHQCDVLEITTDINGEFLIDTETLFLSQAGGNSYFLLAKDSYGNVVTSVNITTHRKLFYIEVKMDNLSIAESLSVFIEEYKTHFLTLESLAEVNIPHFPNIGDETEVIAFSDMIESVCENYINEDSQCLALVYTDHLAVKDEDVIINTQEYEVGPNVTTPVRILIYNEDVEEYQMLWQDIDDTDWFNKCLFFDSDTGMITDIEKEQLTLVGSEFPGCYVGVDVDVTNLPTGRGVIEIRVNTVNRMRLGLSLGKNIVAVCTKSWWVINTEIKQNETMIHEVGHEIGMVPSGTEKALDKPVNFYDAQGHIGPHCHAGIEEQELYDDYTTLSTCVMYGALNEKTTFCDDCAKCVKKLDLSDIINVECMV